MIISYAPAAISDLFGDSIAALKEHKLFLQVFLLNDTRWLLI